MFLFTWFKLCTVCKIVGTLIEVNLLFYSNRKKRMRQLQKKIKTGTLNLNHDDPFELFIAATNIRYCYYNETHKILGNTYGMCVLQVIPSFFSGVCKADI